MSWDERYSQGDHAASAPIPFLVELADRLPATGSPRLLDLACGAGRHAVLFAERGWDVTAVDSSQVALRILAGRNPKIQAVLADLENYEMEVGQWDLIMVSFYLQRSLFERIRKGVKPGGRAAIAIPLEDPRDGVKPMNPLYLLKPGELAAEFGGWTIEHYRETEPEPPARRIAEVVAAR